MESLKPIKIKNKKTAMEYEVSQAEWEAMDSKGFAKGYDVISDSPAFVPAEAQEAQERKTKQK